MGLLYFRPERSLRSFSNRIGDVLIYEITFKQVSDFLCGPRTSPPTWRNKYNLLKHFFEYWAARGKVPTVPMPPVRPASPQTFRPYIYSRTEVRLLLRAARVSQRRTSCVIEAQTLRMILLFLYATGALTGEALRLSREDVDFENGFITIRGNRFGRFRRIPIGQDLLARLCLYSKWSARKMSHAPSFFQDREGKPINEVTLSHTFRKLRRITGIARHDGASYQPRMHDFRQHADFPIMPTEA
jgi:integrase/recombinase XerD